MPLVSFVMPCYRNEGTLTVSVESVLAQSVPDWELIAVDDGSDDGTGALLDETAKRDGRIRVIHQPNGGVSAARNTGLRAAQGDWVFFLDADDRLLPDALEVLLALADGSTDIVCGAYEMHYPDDGDRREICRCADGDLQTVYESLIRGDSALNSMCARLYRRDFLERHQLFAPAGIRIGEDVLFNLAAFSKAACWRMIERVVYVYEFCGDSAMHRAQSTLYESNLPMIRRIDAFIAEQHLETELFRAHIDLYNRMLRASYGRFGAAKRLDREIARRITEGVREDELPKKQKLYYRVLRYMPSLSILIP